MRVAILRHQLFLPSEPFIPDQAAALPVDPLLVSRSRILNRRDDLTAISMSEQLSKLDVLRYMIARDYRPLVRLLRSERLDLLHAHFGVEGFYSYEAARKLQIPHVTTLHGFDVSRSSKALFRSGKLAWMHYSLGRRSFLETQSALVCVSEHVRRRAIELGARPESISVITTGVNTRALAPGPSPDTPTVVHVARLVEKKGTSDLIEAVARAQRTVPELSLRIVGGGPLRDQLEAQARATTRPGSVEFLGVKSHDEALAVIASGTLLACTSVTATDGDQEGLPQVVLEAGALGKPTVVTDHGGLPEAVIDGVTGFVVAERSPLEIAERLVTLAGSTSLAESMGVRARARVAEHFDVYKQAAKLANLYRGLR